MIVFLEKLYNLESLFFSIIHTKVFVVVLLIITFWEMGVYAYLLCYGSKKTFVCVPNIDYSASNALDSLGYMDQSKELRRNCEVFVKIYGIEIIVSYC